MRRPLPLIAVLLALTAPLSSAQVPTGTPPFGSFGGGPDTINLANLNAHIGIPVLHKAGRGTNFTYDLSYDTSVWYPVGASGNQSWKSVYNWGWRAVTEASIGYISFNQTTSPWCLIGGNYVGQQTAYSNWVYHDAWGVPHWFGYLTTYYYQGPPAQCTNADSYTTGTGLSDGYTLSVTGPNVNSLVGADGKNIHAPVNVGTGSGSFTDRNGNQITANTSGQFYDTLSSTIPVLTVAGSGTPTSPTTYTYTAPSGANAPYTMKYTAYTVQTKFLCSGIADYGPISNNLVSEIDLPDGSKYIFDYENTPGDTHSPHYRTGRLASVTLPTGGMITYGYSGGNAGINCSDGSVATLTRTTPDGTWTYAQVKGSGAASTTTITDPQSNVTVDNFSGIYLTQSLINQNSSTLLETIGICYNNNFANCSTAVVSSPITKRDVYRTLPNLANPGISETTYDAYGNLTEDKEMDYVAVSNGSPYLSDTKITYASLGNNIASMPSSVQVYKNGPTLVSQTNYYYDETGVAAPPGTTPQHVAVSGSRGNLTSINYPTGGLTSHSTYYDTGTISTATDVNGAVTTYNYPDATSTCGNAFPTSVNEPLSLMRYMTWNCTGGVQLTAKDENNQTVTTTYNDPYFWRPNAVSDQGNNVTSVGYSNPNAFNTSLLFNNNQSEANTGYGSDGLGRSIQVSHIQSPNGTPSWDQVIQSYDSNGRLWKTSVPCATTGPWTCPLTGQTITYDALNRSHVITDGGGGTVRTVTNTYSQNDVLVTVSPAPSGENVKSRQLEYDALGRLTSVCEISSASGGGACGQHVAQNGFLTLYSYDALSNLTGVTQNAQAATALQQTRSYSYDAMSRLTSESNPESGTTTYSWDSATGTTCALASPGNMIKKVDANGNWTCYNYDSLHRLTDVGNNIQNAANPVKQFRYDNWAGLPGSTKPSGLTNTLGRLVEVATAVGSLITDEWFSYTARGETSDVYASTPHSGGYYHSALTYWANGAPNVLTGPAGYSTSYSVDGEGRPYQVPNLVTNTAYSAASLPTAVTYASGDSDSFTYDPNTNRMTQYKFTVGTSPQSLVGNLTWNANGTLQTQNITDPFNSANTQNCSYSYDDVSRVSNANCGSAAAQTFTYDPFGNINKSGSPYSFQPSYTSSTNRIASIGSFAPTYDGAGNVTNDSLHTYSWDVYGRPVTIDSVNLTYDALGRMVEQNRSGAYTQFVYSPTGQKMQIMNGQASTKSIVNLPGGGQAIFTAAGQYYYHPDHLGSSRFASTSNRTMSFDTAYAPFGEPYATSGTADLSFTGQRQDTVSGLYDFPAREYSIQGRWPSPDPAGLDAVDPSNPQSWNRYAYVMNNPLALVDPLGLSDCHPGEACWGIGGDNPGAGIYSGPNGCDALADIECETNREIAGDIRAENRFAFTALNGLIGAEADYHQSVAADEARQAAKLDIQYIIVHCSGVGADSWECSPWGPYAQFLAAGWQPALIGDDARLRFLGRGVVRGAGGIGDPRFIAGFYGASALLAAPEAIAADVARGPWESALFGRNGGFLNSRDELRVGFGWFGEIGQNVFRVTGDWLNGRHFLNWPWPW